MAVGGTAEGDPYLLPTLLAQLVLLDAGWEAVNLAPIPRWRAWRKRCRSFCPRLLWLSVSYLEDSAGFIGAYRDLYRAAERQGVAVAVAGQAMLEPIRSAVPYTTYGDGLSHLAAFADTPPQTETRAPRPATLGPDDPEQIGVLRNWRSINPANFPPPPRRVQPSARLSGILPASASETATGFTAIARRAVRVSAVAAAGATSARERCQFRQASSVEGRRHHGPQRRLECPAADRHRDARTFCLLVELPVFVEEPLRVGQVAHGQPDQARVQLAQGHAKRRQGRVRTEVDRIPAGVEAPSE